MCWGKGARLNNVVLNAQFTALQLRAERLLLILSVLLLALAFPLQVMVRSPLPALFPYAVLGIAFAIRIHAQYRKCEIYDRRVAIHLNFVDLGVMAYVVLVAAHGGFNLVVGAVGLMKIGSIIVNYIFPLSFYLYFRFYVSGWNIRSIMIGVLAASALISVYSIPHAFLKMNSAMTPSSVMTAPGLYERPNDNNVNLYRVMEKYQQAAGEYSRMRADESPNFINGTMRVGGTRSAGLLESHSVSAAWIALGMFAALALISTRRCCVHFALAMPFMTMLLIFNYYTAIIATLTSLLIIAFYRKCGFHHVKLVILICILAPLLIYLITDISGSKANYLTVAGKIAQIQFDMIFGNLQVSYLELIYGQIKNYIHVVSREPLVFFFGDGFGIYYPYSFPKGSDVGFVESMARLGIPLLLLLLMAVVTWTYHFILNKMELPLTGATRQAGFPIFAIGILVFVITNDIHYSIWPAKSILPILMILFSQIGITRFGFR